MNLWQKIFNKDVLDLFLKVILSAGKVLLGAIAKDLFEVCKLAVNEAEKQDLDGAHKFEFAYKFIVQHVGEPSEIMKFIIKIFVEALVLEIKKRKGLITF